MKNQKTFILKAIVILLTFCYSNTSAKDTFSTSVKKENDSYKFMETDATKVKTNVWIIRVVFRFKPFEFDVEFEGGSRIAPPKIENGETIDCKVVNGNLVVTDKRLEGLKISKPIIVSPEMVKGLKLKSNVIDAEVIKINEPLKMSNTKKTVQLTN